MNRQQRYHRPALFQYLALSLLLLIPPLTQAATYVVDSSADEVLANDSSTTCLTLSGTCTLRGAIQAANNNPGHDTIQLGFFDFFLSIGGRNENSAASGDLDVNDDLTITGGNIPRNIIDASGLDRVFHVLSGAELTLQNVSIRGGVINVDLDGPESALPDNPFGAGIYIQGTSTANLTNVDVNSNNIIVTGSNLSPAFQLSGGGIFVDGGTVTANNTATYSTVFIDDSEIYNNQAPSGGGIAIAGRADIRGSLIDNNRATGDLGDSSANGGAIANLGGYLTIGSSTISNNLSLAQGGGIYTINRGQNIGYAIITNSAITGNESQLNGGGIANYMPLALNNSVVSNNIITLNSSGFKGSGAGIFNSGIASLDIVNSTISTNTGAYSGGGIFNTRDLSLTNVTVHDNEASPCVGCGTNGELGGNQLTIYNSSGGFTAAPGVVLANAILVDGPNSNTAEPACAGETGFGTYVDTIGGNMESGNSCNLNTAAPNNDLINVVSAGLGPLAIDSAYPQTTAVHPLLTGSPAINGGINNYCPSVDQRFLLRVGNCDIGAYEYGGSSQQIGGIVDIKATITDSPDPATPNNPQIPLTYKVTISNLYIDSSAQGVLVYISLPQSFNFTTLTYASADAIPVCQNPTPSNVISCTIDSLPGLGLVEIFVTGIPTEVGIIEARVDVSNATPLDSFANNNTNIREDTVVSYDPDDTTNYCEPNCGGGGGGQLHPLLLSLAALRLMRRRIHN